MRSLKAKKNPLSKHLTKNHLISTSKQKKMNDSNVDKKGQFTLAFLMKYKWSDENKFVFIYYQYTSFSIQTYIPTLFF